MPTSVDIKNLKINKLTEAQYDAAVQGGVIGENELSVLTDAKLEQIQVSALPTASADELGNIYQYVGATDANYTNGYFYKCVSDGQSPATYSWTQVEVQPAGSSLPDQTGQSGKFLTTDGTDASWSDKPLVNNATSDQQDSLFIGGTGTGWQSQRGASVGLTAQAGREGASIGYGAIGGDRSVGIGYGTVAYNRQIMIGYRAGDNSAHNSATIAIGCRAQVNVNAGIQLGGSADGEANVTNNTWGAFCVCTNGSNNHILMDKDGYVPTDRLTKVNTTITLAAADWSSNSQTVSVTGMTATGVVMVSPDPADQADYTAAGIICSAQAAGILTFTCDSTPANDIDVVVVML